MPFTLLRSASPVLIARRKLSTHASQKEKEKRDERYYDDQTDCIQ